MHCIILHLFIPLHPFLNFNSNNEHEKRKHCPVCVSYSAGQDISEVFRATRTFIRYVSLFNSSQIFLFLQHCNRFSRFDHLLYLFPAALATWAHSVVYRPWLVRMPQQAFFLSGACSGSGSGWAPLFRDISRAPDGTSRANRRLTAAEEREAAEGRRDGEAARERPGQSDWLIGFVVVVFNPHDQLTCAHTCERERLFLSWT